MPDKKTLNLPPLPPLTWDDASWRGHDVLPGWAGSQERQGPYASRSSEQPSTGQVEFSIAPPDDDPNNPGPPAADQIATFNFIKANDAAIAAAALEALFARYPEWQEAYGYDDDDRVKYMPDLATLEDLKRLVGLSTVHILTFAKEGHAYFGLELGCTWDEEHGTGVLLHKTRVIEVGSADVSFDFEPARADGGEVLES
jgi:hypothetical protein